MKFRQKLKTRRMVAYLYTIIGLLMILLNLKLENPTLSSFGAMFTVLGIARTVQYHRIWSSEENIKKREIVETDERNVAIWTLARSMAFSIYLFLCGIAVIVLQLMNYSEAAQWVAYMLAAFVGIYWLCYCWARKQY